MYSSPTESMSYDFDSIRESSPSVISPSSTDDQTAMSPAHRTGDVSATSTPMPGGDGMKSTTSVTAGPWTAFKQIKNTLGGIPATGNAISTCFLYVPSSSY
jgi:hypothetical protein